MNIFKLSLLAVLTASLVLGGAGCKRGPKTPTPIPEQKITSIGTPGTATPVGPLDVGNKLPGNGGVTDGRPGTYELPSGIKPNPDNTIPTAGEWDRSKFVEDRDTFKSSTVYFDFDRAAVRASERVKVEEVATVLKAQPNNMVLIEGHCDERGTEEYNRALGERRALAIREYLVNLGIQAERVHTISYGEDKPADLGNNESAWAKNRRGEFILLKPRQ